MPYGIPFLLGRGLASAARCSAVRAGAGRRPGGQRGQQEHASSAEYSSKQQRASLATILDDLIERSGCDLQQWN